MLHVVIMAGGSGTRFWPASRRDFPKQFLTFGGTRSLIQQAFDRIADLTTPEHVWVVTNRRYGALTRSQLPEVSPDHILEEPCGRNTAPCIGWAASRIAAVDPEATLLVMPADHVIAPVERFRDCVREALAWIDRHPEASVLFGARPTFPATGYGYIERGERADSSARLEQVPSFREKPDLATATRFLATGRFLWNCGIFVWRAAHVLDLLTRFEPQLASDLARFVEASQRTAPRVPLLACPAVPSPDSGCEPKPPPEKNTTADEQFAALKAISIDHAVMERAENVYVLPATYDWDDVGSWQALARLHGTDSNGNTIIGRHAGVATRDCIIQSEPGHLVATFGVTNCIIVQTPQATLIARKDDESALRQLVQYLETHGYDEFL